MGRRWIRGALAAALLSALMSAPRAAAMTVSPPAVGAITTAVVTADGGRAAIAGWVEFTGCPQRCQTGRTAGSGWVGVVTIQPDTAQYACTGSEVRDQDANTQVIAMGSWSTENGRYEFDRNPMWLPSLPVTGARRLCLSVAYWDGGYYAGGFVVDSRSLDVGEVKEMPVCGRGVAPGQDCRLLPCSEALAGEPCTQPQPPCGGAAYRRLCTRPPPRPLPIQPVLARRQANRALVDRFRGWRGNRHRKLTCRKRRNESWLCNASWSAFGHRRSRVVRVATYDGKRFDLTVSLGSSATRVPHAAFG